MDGTGGVGRVKLAVLGGGGVRMPMFVRGVLSRPAVFDQICLFEPDEQRRRTIGRLAVELAGPLGHPGMVTVTPDAGEAFTGADFVFSAIRVGGDEGRVIDEDVALRRGLVGQETTGPGGCAMALRTIPVVLSYCELLARYAPGAVLINFTNPAGLITHALSQHAAVRAVGVCDTPSGAIERLAQFLEADRNEVAYSYTGLNHLGWISSFRAGGEERIGTLLDRYEELQRFDHRFAMFDPGLVRMLGAVPTEYLYYFYEPQRYVDAVARAGASRGTGVRRLNAELLSGITKAFETGDVHDAWSTYSTLLSLRRDSYMRGDTEGTAMPDGTAKPVTGGRVTPAPADAGGYEGIALRVIEGLTGRKTGKVIVNTRNGATLDFLDPDDVIETPAHVDGGGIAPLAAGELPSAAQGLITRVKEYERQVVEAAVTGDAGLAALALSLHPLVPGVTVAKEMMGEYRERHGPHLAYLR
jgi:6-phospho-beta-glucosidase